MSEIRDDQFINDLDSSMLDIQIGNDPYFDTPSEFEVSHNENIIEKLIHLSRFGNLLTLVVGNNGSGKTNLLNKFLSSNDDSCLVCHIKGQPLLSIDQLFQQVIESFAGETTFTGIPLTANQYEEWAEQLPTISGNRLLIIDDAEVLSASVLHEICQLSAMQQAKETPHLHIILFGNYDLNVILEQAAQGILDEDGIYTIDIPSLNEDEAKKWVEYLLAEAGIKFLPEQEILDDILEKGQGNLSLLAENVIEYTAIDRELINFDEEPERWRISMVGYWFASLTVLILLVLGLFFFQNEIAELTGMNDNDDLVQQINPTIINVSSNDDSSTNEGEIIEQLDSDAIQSTTSELEQNVDAISDSSAIALLVDNTELETEPNTDINSEESFAESTKIKSEEVLTEDTTVSQLSMVEVPADTPVVKNLTPDEQFLMSQPNTNYVVQILGLSKESSVQRFISEQQNPDIHYFKTSLNDKAWFIIVLGSYQNHADAAAARSNLSTELIQYGPWIKSIQAIKNDISNNHQ